MQIKTALSQSAIRSRPTSFRWITACNDRVPRTDDCRANRQLCSRSVWRQSCQVGTPDHGSIVSNSFSFRSDEGMEQFIEDTMKL